MARPSRARNVFESSHPFSRTSQSVPEWNQEKTKANRLPRLRQKSEKMKAHWVDRDWKKEGKMETNKEVGVIQMRQKRHLEEIEVAQSIR
jgi:hypothetical protein